MNPLGLNPERFTVACNEEGEVLAFGQLEDKGSFLELRSMVVEPSCR